MEKIISTVIIIFVIIFTAIFLVSFYNKRKANSLPKIEPASNQAQPATLEGVNAPAPETAPPAPSSTDTVDTKSANGFVAPLDRASERVSKKYFGIFITPQTSPVQPERFRGYHTGTDFEIFPEEQSTDVPVVAVCDGKLVLKKSASGYGGVAVESCALNGAPINVVYGHLKLSSITAHVGQSLKAGDTLGLLGAAYSAETDGERKHLHLAFHKASSINILGYVQSQSELSGWVDPCLYVCGK